MECGNEKFEYVKAKRKQKTDKVTNENGEGVILKTFGLIKKQKTKTKTKQNKTKNPSPLCVFFLVAKKTMPFMRFLMCLKLF